MSHWHIQNTLKDFANILLLILKGECVSFKVCEKTNFNIKLNKFPKGRALFAKWKSGKLKYLTQRKTKCCQCFSPHFVISCWARVGSATNRINSSLHNIRTNYLLLISIKDTWKVTLTVIVYQSCVWQSWVRGTALGSCLLAPWHQWPCHWPVVSSREEAEHPEWSTFGVIWRQQWET